MRFRRLAPSLLILLACADVARAAVSLPIIVTYELERQHDAALVEQRDPREFWVRQILTRLEEKKPAGTLGLKQPATALIRFAVGRDGTLMSRVIAKSSGVAAVDNEALAMLERAQPFPPMPAAMSQSELAFSLPLRFR